MNEPADRPAARDHDSCSVLHGTANHRHPCNTCGAWIEAWDDTVSHQRWGSPLEWYHPACWDHHPCRAET